MLEHLAQEIRQLRVRHLPVLVLVHGAHERVDLPGLQIQRVRAEVAQDVVHLVPVQRASALDVRVLKRQRDELSHVVAVELVQHVRALRVRQLRDRVHPLRLRRGVDHGVDHPRRGRGEDLVVDLVVFDRRRLGHDRRDLKLGQPEELRAEIDERLLHEVAMHLPERLVLAADRGLLPLELFDERHRERVRGLERGFREDVVFKPLHENVETQRRELRVRHQTVVVHVHVAQQQVDLFPRQPELRGVQTLRELLPVQSPVPVRVRV
mmetsp:Transcript_11605/g.41745  ORF Transcript_11605/g.41745 Transcript_11605/m.41745 type:complete len:266 (-) Transcript_11605:626-1423(-)